MEVSIRVWQSCTKSYFLVSRYFKYLKNITRYRLLFTLIPYHLSSGTFAISYFCCLFFWERLLGFTFLLYRAFHHSLHRGPPWRNTQNIFCFKESNFRKGEICSQNQLEAQRNNYIYALSSLSLTILLLHLPSS